MQKTILSTADVARLFDVTETTVKRWADEGTLKCQRTPGGHRKFEIRNVVEFAEKNKFDPVGVIEFMRDDRFSRAVQASVLSRDFPALAGEFVERTTNADQDDLLPLFSYLYEHKVALWEIFDLVIRLGMQEIGERWLRGELGVDDEHRATARTAEALAMLMPQVLIKPEKKKSALLAAVGEELHDLGLRCAGYVFEAEGWRIHYLGARTPRSAVLATMKKAPPDVVAISVSFGDAREATMADLREISAAAHEIGAKLAVGGRAAPAASGESGIVDEILTSSKDVVEYIRRLAKENGAEPAEGKPKNEILEQ
jgi:excisionase family DNA binding protein